MALSKSGHSAHHDDLAGGYEGVRLKLEGGYHVHIAQDMDATGHPWYAGVSHGPHFESLEHPDDQYPYNVDLGFVHPRNLSKALEPHMGPKGSITQQIQTHVRRTREQ